MLGRRTSSVSRLAQRPGLCLKTRNCQSLPPAFQMWLRPAPSNWTELILLCHSAIEGHRGGKSLDELIRRFAEATAPETGVFLVSHAEALFCAVDRWDASARFGCPRRSVSIPAPMISDLALLRWACESSLWNQFRCGTCELGFPCSGALGYG